MREEALIASILFTLILFLSSYLIQEKEISPDQISNLSNNQKINIISQVQEVSQIKPNLCRIKLNNSIQVYFKSNEILNLKNSNVSITARVSIFDGSTRIIAEKITIIK